MSGAELAKPARVLVRVEEMDAVRRWLLSQLIELTPVLTGAARRWESRAELEDAEALVAAVRMFWVIANAFTQIGLRSGPPHDIALQIAPGPSLEFLANMRESAVSGLEGCASESDEHRLRAQLRVAERALEALGQ